MDTRFKITSLIILLALLATAFSAYFYVTSTRIDKSINSFTDCKKAGYPILESYPEQCRTSSGTTFIENIGNGLEKTDLILLTTPQPNQKISLPLTIKGKARGSWFFEASFPVKLIDEGGFEIAAGNAKAQGDWMTEDFVPFTANLSGVTPKGNKGTLILEKSNPSGLPENSDQLEVPVEF